MADRVRIDIDLARFNARIHRYVQASGRDADAAVLQIATDVLADTVEVWPVGTSRPGYTGGESRAAWWGPRRIGPASYQIGNPTPQAKAVEYGTWPNPGPLTHQYGGRSLPAGLSINPGVYSNKAPEAPLRRALAANYQKLGRILKALKNQWGR